MIPFDYIFIGGLADCSSYQHLLFRITCIIGAVWNFDYISLGDNDNNEKFFDFEQH